MMWRWMVLGWLAAVLWLGWVEFRRGKKEHYRRMLVIRMRIQDRLMKRELTRCVASFNLLRLMNLSFV